MLPGVREQIVHRLFTRDRVNPSCDEASNTDVTDDRKCVLIQVTAEKLDPIDAALLRLEVGKYGRCFAPIYTAGC